MKQCPSCGHYAQGGRVSDREIKKQREDRDSAPSKPTGTTEKFSIKGKQTPIGKMTRQDNLAKFRASAGPKLKGLAEGGCVNCGFNVSKWKR